MDSLTVRVGRAIRQLDKLATDLADTSFTVVGLWPIPNDQRLFHCLWDQHGVPKTSVESCALS